MRCKYQCANGGRSERSTQLKDRVSTTPPIPQIRSPPPIPYTTPRNRINLSWTQSSASSNRGVTATRYRLSSLIACLMPAQRPESASCAAPMQL